MRTLTEIRHDIDRLSDERADILHRLSAGHNPELAAEHQRLEDEIATLWDEQRHTRAMIRFGDREAIIQRARHDERLSRAA
jgi:cell division protein FtsB